MMNNMLNNIPYNPSDPAKNMMGKRSILIATAWLKLGMIKEAIPVMDTTITIGAETIPA